MNFLRSAGAYLRARIGEISSIVSASGASAAVAAYLLGQMTADQLKIALVASAVGYVIPQHTPMRPTGAQAPVRQGDAKSIASAVVSAIAKTPHNLAIAFSTLIVIGAGVGACSDAQQAKLQTDVASVQKVATVVQPIASEAACAAQAGANAAGGVADLLGKGDAAAGAALASKAAGIFCNGKQAGSIVTVPAELAPPAAVVKP